MSIEYLTYPEIDKQQWDACINKSANRLIYAKSFYLDAMAPNWHALVLNNYEAVIPLTWKKKWGIAYLYQPAFIQQGGVFFTETLSGETLQAILDEAFVHFKFAEITLNYLNKTGDIKNGEISKRNNFVLPLQSTYPEIYSAFTGGTKKNIKKASNGTMHYKYSLQYLPVLKLYKQLYGERLPHLIQADYRNFSRVCKYLSEQNNLIVRTVTNSQDETLAAVIILIDRNRLYNLVSCVTREGRNVEANYFLYNELIKEFCKSRYILDFEGSDLKGIAEFYNGFRPQNEPYPFVKVNNLHPIIKMFKR